MLLSALVPPGMAGMAYPRVTYNAPDPFETYFPISGGSVIGLWEGQIRSFYPEGLQNQTLKMQFTRPDISLFSPHYSGPMFAAPQQIQQNFNTRLQEAVQRAGGLGQVWQHLDSFPTVPRAMLESWQREAEIAFPALRPGIPSVDQPRQRRTIAERRDYITAAVRAFQNAQASRYPFKAGGKSQRFKPSKSPPFHPTIHGRGSMRR
jgi:hypothetical protein